MVNATPLGMAGTGARTDSVGPIDPGLLGPEQTVIDLVYHPAMTPWLRAARDRGAAIGNGLAMLVHQAALQLAAWTGVDPPLGAMWAALDSSGAEAGPARDPAAGSASEGTGSL